MSVTSADIEISNVTHYFQQPGARTHTRALEDVSLHVPAGQFLAMVGPSGCGKTTLLNMVAGLIRPTHGTVRRGDHAVAGPDREVAYMLARPALLPWRTARENVEFGLEIRGVRRSRRGPIAERLLESTGLSDFAGSYPAQLSQGMRQRVAIARTFAIEPKYILMDEPFAALDAQTKLGQQDKFVQVWEQTGSTVIFVTHDLGEAILMADRVVVFSGRPGRIKADLTVPFPRPRDMESLRFSDGYRDLHESMWTGLRDDVRQG